uniref:Metaxin-2 n=1 Tax=Panagrolaimus sp. JU765 TaxID=591449 RepID=A0AC34RTE9_9BILA
MSSNYFLQKTVVDTLEQADAEWKDVKLISPWTQTQSLLYEYGEHIAIHAFLKMVDLPFISQQRPNAVDMSPTGRVPFLRLKETLVADYPNIVNFVELKGIKLSDARTAAEQTDLEAYISLIDEDLRHVEMYIVWLDDETYEKVTKPRTSSAYTFPVSWILPSILRRQKKQYLQDRGYAEKSMKEIISTADIIFQALSAKLGTKKYIIGDQPSELDCLAFGHIYTILTTELPNLQLVNCLKKYLNLIEFCKQMEKELFEKHDSGDA